MALELAILPGATQLTPLRQGNLSRLCGLYSFLNGIQLALYPQRITKPQLQELYLHGVSHLSRRRQLRHVLGVGMSEAAWLELGAALIQHVNESHGSTLDLSPTLSGEARRRRGRALHSIASAVADGSPVVVLLEGALNHFSVIAGCSEQRLRLFDSSGLRYLNNSGIDIGSSSLRRHQLSATGVVTIIDDW